ncbi:histidine kinase [Modestobacter sp. VKM Ac-2986]|uniref:sensor histidine kinase n=1 Tax=Modestobacter sp. VKM Ac-2986 TaxID=3004140 RepID=UPI0022AA0768|nr:histidine kinase [Modestobacter sp. VKM Ac-2986]MCZ2828510.1 histidine kinase [Modestobacter sp. VKM Ac-2986]
MTQAGDGAPDVLLGDAHGGAAEEDLPGGPAEDAAVDDEVVAAFLADVALVSPRLVADPDLRALLAGRALAVLHTTRARLRGQPAPERAPDVGAVRARSHVHPAESLRAASLLFRHALPPLLSQAAGLVTGPRAAERIALVLHEVIDALVVPAATSYVDVLLSRISDANRDERRRVARDLHDHTSHGIGAAMQGLDLALHLVDTGRPLDPDRLRSTRQLLLDTLNDVRSLATRLRDMVGHRTLAQALQEYLDFTVPVGLSATLTEQGEEAVELPSHVKEESYLIVREAIRNSLLHARGATRLDVTLRVAGAQLTAVVEDDGAGFDPATVDTTRTVGLASLRERAHGLGGRAVLDAGPGGVTMTLTVPLTAALA